jgi:hypothetical protein
VEGTEVEYEVINGVRSRFRDSVSGKFETSPTRVGIIPRLIREIRMKRSELKYNDKGQCHVEIESVGCLSRLGMFRIDVEKQCPTESYKRPRPNRKSTLESFEKRDGRVEMSLP